MAGPFGQPGNGPVDLGADIGAGYQQNAANKISQARVSARKGFTSGYAGKYGVTDVAKATKGLSDSDIYEMAANLVNKRRGPAQPATTPGGSGTAPKPAPKPTTTTAPKVTAKTSTTKTAATKATTTTTTKRRPRRPATKTSTTPTLTATQQATATRLTSRGL